MCQVGHKINEIRVKCVEKQRSNSQIAWVDDLKGRIERLAVSAKKTPHVFMVEALSQEVDRSELRDRFAIDSSESER